MISYAPTLRTVAIPRTTPLADALVVVSGAALVALAAQVSIPLPFTPVPLTGQTFAVLLVGAAVGPTLGVASMLLYLGAGAIGAPIYAGGSSGFHVFSTATGGYLVGFVLAAALVGWFSRLRWDRTLSSALGAMLCGNVVIYGFGVVWLGQVLDTNLEQTLEFGLYPFIVGDLLKVYAAALLLPTAWKLVGRKRGRSGDESTP
jgi:biotin transport system substrate-specific component